MAIWWALAAAVAAGAIALLISPRLCRAFDARVHPAILACVTAIITGTVVFFSPSSAALGLAVAACAGTIAAAVDWRVHRIPTIVVNPASLALVLVTITQALRLGDWSLVVRGAVCGVGSWLLFWLASRAKVMGRGDVRLAALLAGGAGVASVATALTWLVASFLVAGIVSLILLVTRRVQRRDRIALAPYLVLGLVVAVVADIPGFS